MDSHGKLSAKAFLLHIAAANASDSELKQRSTAACEATFAWIKQDDSCVEEVAYLLDCLDYCRDTCDSDEDERIICRRRHRVIAAIHEYGAY